MSSSARPGGPILVPYVRTEVPSVALQMEAEVIVGGSVGGGSAPTILGPLSYQALQAMGPELDEVNGSHDTIGGAQRMPSLPVSMVDGSLAATDTLDLYAIPLSSRIQSLRVDVVPTDLSTQLPRRLWMLDTGGDLIGDWQLPEGATSFSLEVTPLGRAIDSQLVFGVSHGSDLAPDPASAPIHYELIVEQQVNDIPFGFDLSDSASTVGLAGKVVTLPRTVSTLPAPPVGAGTPPSSDPSSLPPPTSPSSSPTPPSELGSTPGPGALNPPPVGVSAGQTTGTGVAINPGAFGLVPLPTRSAASFGGRLAEGSLAPPINRADLAMVDLNLIELAPQNPAPVVASPDESMVVDAALPGEPSAQPGPELVTVQGPGGFPILAAAILTNQVHPTYAAPGSQLPELLPDADPMAASQHSSDPCPLPIVAPVAPVTSAGRPQPAQAHAMNQAAARSRAPRRSPLLFSLNIAATLALGLLLPDLVATWRGTKERTPLPRLVRFWLRKRHRAR